MSLIKFFFDDIRGVNVIIVGDVMLDSYIIGKIERKSPEAPVPIVNVSNKENRIGGAANVALNIKALGGIPHLCSCIGDDDAGNNFMSLMQKNGLSSEGIISSNKRKTTVKERIIVNKKHVLRIDDEMTSTISFNVQKKLIQIIKKLIDKSQLLIFQDYDKGILNKKFIHEIISFGKNKITITADPKNQNFEFYQNIDLFKPNLLEVCRGFNLNYKRVTIKQLELASKKHLKKKSINCLMITMSKKGILVINKNSTKHFKVFSRKIIDVSGAGDTVISIASICCYMSTSSSFLGHFSNLAGGLVCESSGVVPINKRKLSDEASKNDLYKYL